MCCVFGSSACAAIVISDPMGDTFGTSTPVHDILSVSAETVGTDIIFSATFNESISAPSAGLLDAIEGYIDIDADGNPATGTLTSGYASHLDQLGQGAPSPGLGVEYYLDLGFFELLSNGLVDVILASDNSLIGQAPITFSPNSFEITVPLALLGGDDSKINLGAIFGPFAGSATDQAPNNTTVPEPSSLLLFSVGMVCVMGFRRTGNRRRKRQDTGS